MALGVDWRKFVKFLQPLALVVLVLIAVDHGVSLLGYRPALPWVLGLETKPVWFSLDYWAYTGGVTSTSRSEVLRNLGLLAVAIVGVCFGMWRAWTAHRQANVAEQGLVTDRFSTAAKHLGSEQLPVRLGGIYALWRLTQDSPGRDVISVIDILCAFVRNPTTAEDMAKYSGQRVRPDVLAVMKLIGDKNAGYRRHLPVGYRRDFDGSFLVLADLVGVALMNAKFVRAKLIGANLTGADLTGAKLSFVNLMKANLTGTDLTGADLSLADNLTDANLTGTILTRTILTGANLTGAKNLTQAQLDVAHYERDRPPKLPPGLVLPEPPPAPED